VSRHPSSVQCSILAVIVAHAGTALAQGGVEEILVTAQKREQRLQDVPISVSAFSGDLMEDAGIEDVKDLVTITPGFSGKTEDSFTDALAIRGISTNDFGIGGDPSVAVFQDGVYQGRNGGALTSFFDIERAEVVKGPQGTLFGRNAIAGAISVITRRPIDELEGNISLAVEEFDHVEATGTINVPLNDQWYFRGSVHTMEEDGWLENLAGGDPLGFHDRKATRLAIRHASERLDATISASYEDREQSPSVYWDPAAGIPEDKAETDLLNDGIDESEIAAVTANVELDFDNDYTLSSITGWKSFNFMYLEDYDASSERIDNYFQQNEVDYWSQELRLNSPADGPVVWFVGASVYRERIDSVIKNFYDENALCAAIARTDYQDDTVDDCAELDALDPELGIGPVDPADALVNKAETNIDFGDYRGWAVFADATWSVTDRLELTFGGRYTFDEKELRAALPDSGGLLGNFFGAEFFIDGFVSDKRDWTDFTPRGAFRYAVTDDISIYGNIARGYKSGGFATFGFDLPAEPDEDGRAPPGTKPSPFDPETVLSTELGAKTSWLGGLLQVDASVYHYDYEDLQLVFFVEGSSQVGNVAEASGIGAELEVRYAPTDRWDVLVTAGWTNTEIESVNQDFLDEGGCERCVGMDLPFAPHLTTAAIVSYHHPVRGGELFMSAEHHYQSLQYSDVDNIPAIAQPAWNELALRVGYESDNGWTVTVYGENLAEARYFERGWANADPQGLNGFGLMNTLVWPSKPRVFGLSFEHAFGGR
jgi:iron complex outermembrane receptor protein